MESDETRLSSETLKSVFKTSPSPKKRTEEEQEKLREYIKTKRSERMDNYKKHQQELRSLERTPYQPTSDSMKMV